MSPSGCQKIYLLFLCLDLYFFSGFAFIYGMGMSLRITKEAEDKLHYFVNQNPGFMPKIAVSSGGCSGFKYVVGLDKPLETDDVIYLDSGMSILIPKDCHDLLYGVTLDYKTSLMSEGFTFDNPGAHSCGCGSSFRPKEAEDCN